MTTHWLAGADGCKAGWIVALLPPDESNPVIRVFDCFNDVVAAPEQPAIIAIDMPIGLPERIGPGGRGPEHAVRALLDRRRPSVFSVPSRRAVYAKDYADACRLASETSNPPRKVSRQFFGLAKKIQEIDTRLRAEPALISRVYEVHPEMAFWRLNGERELCEPKKSNAGLALRRALLVGEGFAQNIVDKAPPSGAVRDDLLDALACAAIARRIHKRVAKPFPDPPLRDRYGLPIAIWA
jgi:predicted RNase H-like nuclease